MPRVNVIIPASATAYSLTRRLVLCLLKRSGSFEIIVVNDGSPDNTAALLRPLVVTQRIRYIEQKNAGQASARNRGLAGAKGEYIALLDDDDLWPPDKLQWQIDLLKANPEAGMVSGAATLIDADSLEIGKSVVRDGTISFEDLFLGNPFLSPGQTLIRTKSLRQIGGFNEGIWGADDWDLYFRLALQTPIITSSRTALRYRKHAGNASRCSGRMLAESVKVIGTHLPKVECGTANDLASRPFAGFIGGLDRVLFRTWDERWPALISEPRWSVPIRYDPFLAR